jgi:AcrR family transcriptional regulator
MSIPRRSYRSPLREEQAQTTRERILAALGQLIASAGERDDISMDAIAEAAGVERRTVFRHFESRDVLFRAYFQWLNDTLGAEVAPRTPAEMAASLRSAFRSFDAHESAMRSAIHSRPGREMRSATIPARRDAFAACLASVTSGLSASDRARVEALAHLLYSAPAWEVLKDYGGLTGSEAGEAAAWALDVILSAVAPHGTTDALPPSSREENEP